MTTKPDPITPADMAEPEIPADALPDLAADPWGALCRLSDAAAAVLGTVSTQITIRHGQSITVEVAR